LCVCRLYQVLAFGRPTIPESVVARVTWSVSEFYTPLNFYGTGEDRIVKFCARVGPRGINRCDDKLSPGGRGFYFWQISVNISKTVQDIDILTDLQWQTNRKSYMAYQTAATAVTFNDFNGHSPVAGLFKCTPSNICATRFQLTVCSHGSSALAELLVIIWRFLGNVCVQLVRKSSRVRVCVCVDRCTCR